MEYEPIVLDLINKNDRELLTLAEKIFYLVFLLKSQEIVFEQEPGEKMLLELKQKLNNFRKKIIKLNIKAPENDKELYEKIIYPLMDFKILRGR